MSFNQLAKEETEMKSTQPCQLAVTIHCLNGIKSPLTWLCAWQLPSDIATYFKFKEWSGRKWRGKKGKSEGKAEKVLCVAEGQRRYSREKPRKREGKGD